MILDGYRDVSCCAFFLSLWSLCRLLMIHPATSLLKSRSGPWFADPTFYVRSDNSSWNRMEKPQLWPPGSTRSTLAPAIWLAAVGGHVNEHSIRILLQSIRDKPAHFVKPSWRQPDSSGSASSSQPGSLILWSSTVRRSFPLYKR